MRHASEHLDCTPPRRKHSIKRARNRVRDIPDRSTSVEYLSHLVAYYEPQALDIVAVCCRTVWQVDAIFNRVDLIRKLVVPRLCLKGYIVRSRNRSSCCSREFLLNRFLEGQHFLNAGTALRALEVD